MQETLGQIMDSLNVCNYYYQVAEEDYDKGNFYGSDYFYEKMGELGELDGEFAFSKFLDKSSALKVLEFAIERFNKSHKTQYRFETYKSHFLWKYSLLRG